MCVVFNYRYANLRMRCGDGDRVKVGGTKFASQVVLGCGNVLMSSVKKFKEQILVHGFIVTLAVL